MAPKAFASSEDPLFSASSLTSRTNHISHHHHHAALDLSSSLHSIAKPKPLKKGPIIRVIHVFAPKLIKTDVANFRTLVQQLTGNHPSSPHEAEEEDAKEESSHDHGNLGCCNHAANNPAKQLESRHQNAREATAIPTMLHTQFEEDYEDPFLHYGIFQTGLASYNHTRFATRFNESNGYYGANQVGLATIEERGGHIPAANQDGLARSEEGINYFSANYDYDDAYSHGSPSSLDSSSTRGDSHSYERGNNACVFSDELELMGGCNSSYYPFINLDDQHLSALDTKLECSLLNPTW